MLTPTDFTLPQVLALVTTHSWLPIAILVAVYVRHLLSDKSKFPNPPIPPTWLPTVTAAVTLVFSVLVARQAGGSWSVALVGGFTTGAASGFFDGIVVGLFGSDPSKVPWWAKLVLALVDDQAPQSPVANAPSDPKPPVELV